MAHDCVSERAKEQLGLYALGVLPPDEAAAVAGHLEEGCPICAAELQATSTTAAALAFDAPLVAPPGTLRARVLRGGRGIRVVRSGTGKWKQLAPGVSATCLHFHRETGQITSLLRMEPGASYAAHRHSAPEQCYIIEGDVFDGRNRFEAGDYEYLEAGTTHGVQSTEGGCLLLIISNVHDELVTE